MSTKAVQNRVICVLFFKPWYQGNLLVWTPSGTSRKKSPQGLVDLTLCLSARQPTTHQTAAPNKTALWISLSCAMKHQRQTLISGLGGCSSVPASSLPLLSFKPLGPASCLPLLILYLLFGQIWTLAIWYQVLGRFELTVWHLCLWLPLHPDSGLQEFSAWPVYLLDSSLSSQSKANSVGCILKVLHQSIEIGSVVLM